MSPAAAIILQPAPVHFKREHSTPILPAPRTAYLTYSKDLQTGCTPSPMEQGVRLLYLYSGRWRKLLEPKQ
jgi:hypothetical protein